MSKNARKNISFLLLSASVIVIPLPVLAQNSEVWAGATSTAAFADGSIRDAYCDITNHLHGSYGALLFAAAGVVGLLSAAIGNIKAVISALVVGVSCATFSGGISFYFGDLCGQGGTQTAAPQRILQERTQEGTTNRIFKEEIIIPNSEEEDQDIDPLASF